MIAGRTWADIVEEEEAQMGIQSSTNFDQQPAGLFSSKSLGSEIGEGIHFGKSGPSTPSGTPSPSMEKDEILTATEPTYTTATTTASQDQAVIPTTQTSKDTKNDFVKDIVKKWHEQSKPKKVVTIVRPTKDAGHLKGQVQDNYKKVNSCKDGHVREFDEDDQVVVTYITTNKKQGLKRTTSLAASGSPRTSSPSRVLSRASSFEHQGTSEMSSDSTLATLSSNSLKGNKYVPPHLRKTLSDSVDSNAIVAAASLNSQAPTQQIIHEPIDQLQQTHMHALPDQHNNNTGSSDEYIHALPDQQNNQVCGNDEHVHALADEEQEDQNIVNNEPLIDQNNVDSNVEYETVLHTDQQQNVEYANNVEYTGTYSSDQQQNVEYADNVECVGAYSSDQQQNVEYADNVEYTGAYSSEQQQNLSMEHSYTLETDQSADIEQYGHVYLENQQSANFDYTHAYMQNQGYMHAYANTQDGSNIHAFADYQYTDSSEQSCYSEEEQHQQQQQQQFKVSGEIVSENAGEIVDENDQKFESGGDLQGEVENGGCSSLNVNAADFQLNCNAVSWNPVVCPDYGMYGMQYPMMYGVPAAAFYDPAVGGYGYQYGYQHDSQSYYEEDGQYEMNDYTLQKRSSLPPSFGKQYSKGRNGYNRGGQGWRRGRSSRDLDSDWRTQKEQRSMHKYNDENDRIVCAPRYRKERDDLEDRIIEVSISSNKKPEKDTKSLKVLLGNQGEKKEIVLHHNNTTD